MMIIISSSIMIIMMTMIMIMIIILIVIVIVIAIVIGRQGIGLFCESSSTVSTPRHVVLCPLLCASRKGG